jgi:hypothetical protein
VRISKNLTLAELTKSQTAVRRGIDNTPLPQHVENLRLVAEKVFEPVRQHFGVPIAVTSGYRSEALNKAIGGSKTSEHCLGMALDLDADMLGGVTNREIFEYILRNLDFNQLIWEFGDSKNPDWVHVSYRPSGNKKEVLRAFKNSSSGATRYRPFTQA